MYKKEESKFVPEFKIIDTIGVLSTNTKSNWCKELNLISWNDREPKYDIRDWSPDHTKMGKGVTLTLTEAQALKELLETIK